MDHVSPKTLIYLQEVLGFTENTSYRIAETLGNDVAEILQENPYELMRCSGFRFKKTDEIARRLYGIAEDDPRRMRAGVLSSFYLEEAEGNCWTRREHLVKKAEYESGLDNELTNKYLDDLISDGDVLEETVSGTGPVLLSSRIWSAEWGVARWLIGQAGLGLEVEADKDLDDDQRTGVRNAFRYGSSIITGGPGRGKTHTIKDIVRIAKALDIEVALLAPTGRAAKRLTELTDNPASTIHRYCGRRELATDEERVSSLLVVDEMSMVSIDLLWRLLKDHVGQVVLVGDPDQLPSIGPGQVLHDLLRSRRLPVVELITNHRSGKQAGLVRQSAQIIDGVCPVSDGSFIVLDTAQPARDAAGIVQQLHEQGKGAGIPVIVSRNNEVFELNNTLREILNPAGKQVQLNGWLDKKRVKLTYRVGDPVMNTENDYSRGVMNGEIGTLVSITRSEFVCEFGSREVSFGHSQQIVPAYAFTGHKYQGCESESVIVVLDAAWNGWPGKNWLYTAVTRAQKNIMLLASKADIVATLGKVDRGTRRTRLNARMQNEY